MDRWRWVTSLPWIARASPTWRVLLDASASGGTGIDATTFWLILVALGGTISALAGLLYKTTRDELIETRQKLEQFQELAPDLVENVEWLVSEMDARRERDGESPWPYRRRRPGSRPSAPRRRT